MNKSWLLCLGLLATATGAQEHSHGAHGAPAVTPPAASGHAHSPYSGLQHRAIKALSDQQLADLRAGRGMALALPAELNGYPGPAHALELAEALGMSAGQRARTQALFGQMQDEARTLGEALIEAEAALDALFGNGKADAASVAAATAEAARAQGRLRASHLQYHLAMMEVLTAEQVDAYNRLRGYR